MPPPPNILGGGPGLPTIYHKTHKVTHTTKLTLRQSFSTKNEPSIRIGVGARGAGGPGGQGVPPNILGGGPGPLNNYPATYLSQAYAIQ